MGGYEEGGAWCVEGGLTGEFILNIYIYMYTLSP